MSRLYRAAARNDRPAYLSIAGALIVAVLIGDAYGTPAAFVFLGVAFVFFAGALTGAVLNERERR